jgi:hypothetical protein
VGSSAKKWVVCFDKQKLPLNITPSVVKGYEGGILACSATKSLIVSSLQGIKELNCLDIRYLGGGFFETLKREMGVVKGGGITSWTTRALYDETGKELYPYVKDSGFEWIKDTKLFFYNIGFLNKGVVNVWGEFLVEPVQEAKYLHFSPNFRLITIDSDGGTMGVMLDENFRLMDVQKFNAIARIRTTKEPDVYHWEQRINTAENTTEIGLFNQRKVEVLLNRFAESRSSLYNDTWAETIVHAEKSVYFTYKVKQLTGLVDMSRGVEILPAIQTYIKYDDMASYNFFRSWNRFDRMNLCVGLSATKRQKSGT